MAIVAKMRCSQVTASAGAWVPCDEVDETNPNFPPNPIVEGDPFWLRESGKQFKRYEPTARQFVRWEMSPVFSTDPDHENKRFASASPSGAFNLTVENPGAMDYVVPGYEYRITIEKVRGPRE